MQNVETNVERFLREIGEGALLDAWYPARAQDLAGPFCPCPMCGGTTTVATFGFKLFAITGFSTWVKANRQYCSLCAQQWDLQGKSAERGDPEVWKRRRFQNKRNGNGHRYGCDLDKVKIGGRQCQVTV